MAWLIYLDDSRVSSQAVYSLALGALTDILGLSNSRFV
jgi:hypothetical protein